MARDYFTSIEGQWIGRPDKVSKQGNPVNESGGRTPVQFAGA
jgi:hypothetical protein